MEDRSLLSAAGVIGTVINDQSGNLFTVDIRDDMAVEWLGTLDDLSFDMLDIAFSPDGSKLYGVGGAPAALYQLDVDMTATGQSIGVDFIDYIRVSPSEDLLLNSLEFGPDGNLYAAGWNDSDESFVYLVDPSSGGAAEVITTDPYTSAGDLTFAEDGSMYITSYLLNEDPQLLRVDPDLTTIEQVGPLLYGGQRRDELYGLTYGPGPEMYAFARNREVFSINRADAEMTLEADLNDQGAGVSFVQGAATLFNPPTNLDVLTFSDLADQEPVQGEIWYAFEPIRNGYVTAEVVGAGSGVDLSLYTQRSDGSLLKRDSGTSGRLDYESAVAGQQYFLQIEGLDAASEVIVSNLLQINTNVAFIYGTDESDVFTFSRGTYYNFSINGLAYQFGFSGNVNMTFDGGSGTDTATLVGQTNRSEDVVLDLEAETGEIDGYGYLLHIANAENISFQSGGTAADTATLIGTAAADDLTLNTNSAELTRLTKSISVSEINSITAQTGGGGDTVTLQGSTDSSATDLVWAYPSRVDFAGDGFSHVATGFETLEAYANDGTSDTIFMYDSDGNDTFAVDPTTATMSGTGFTLNGYGFLNALGYAPNGGDDAAEMQGSLGDDDFLFYKGMAKLYSTTPGGFFLRAKGFEDITANANPTTDSTDIAYLLDTKSHDEFTGGPGEAKMEWNVRTVGGNRLVDTVAVAESFDYVHGYSRYGGDDIANLYDSPGDDAVHAKPDQLKIYNEVDLNNLFFVRAKGFKFANAYATAGGYDLAVMNDSGGQDIYTGSSGFSEMKAATDTYDNRLYSFEKVTAISTTGTMDTAAIYGTTLKNELVAEYAKADPMHYAQISSSVGAPSDFLCYIRGFDEADAYSGSAADVANVDPATADWLLTHGW